MNHTLQSIWIRILLSAIVALSYGCATTVSTPALNDGQLDGVADIGVVLVSVGMHDKEPFFSTKHLPIVSYDLFLLNPDGTIAGKRLMTFSGEPRPEVYFNLAGHLDNGKYGFIHVAELPDGKYLLAGWRHGSSGVGARLAPDGARSRRRRSTSRLRSGCGPAFLTPSARAGRSSNTRRSGYPGSG